MLTNLISMSHIVCVTNIPMYTFVRRLICYYTVVNSMDGPGRADALLYFEYLKTFSPFCNSVHCAQRAYGQKESSLYL